MTEATRTIIFVAVAVISVVIAAVAHNSSTVKPLDEFNAELIGTPFFPEFDDPNTASSLRVIIFDEKQGEPKVFEVASTDGRWTIPSHHGYPVDGEDRLEKTAASVIKIKRGALAGRRESEFERLGVVDPLKRDGALDGVGSRIGLYDGDSGLAEYIIGKQVEGQENTYYVRRPDESQTFITELDIDLSTDFVDWIEPDLLQIDSNDLSQIVINKYSIDEQKGEIVDREVLSLRKPADAGEWKLSGLDEKTEELNTSEVTAMVSNLDDMKIVGVRPKPPILSADLKLNRGVSLDTFTQLDLQSKGFFFASDGQGGEQLFSNEGELLAATDEGVAYILYFGEVFTGDEFEIEVGFANKDGKSKDKKKDSESSDKKSEDSNEDEDSDDAIEDGNLKKSRYLFVRAFFDQTRIGDKPVKPTKPEPKTDDVKEPKEAEPKPDDNGDEKETEDSSNEETDEKSTEEPAEEKVDPEAQYAADLEKYESDLKAYNSKVEAGKKKARELNTRFADWYYVISAQSFESLSLSRDELVKTKEPDPNASTPEEKTGLPEIVPKDKSKTEKSEEEDSKKNTGEPMPMTDSKTETPAKKDQPGKKDDAEKSEKTANEESTTPKSGESEMGATPEKKGASKEKKPADTTEKSAKPVEDDTAQNDGSNNTESSNSNAEDTKE